MQDSTKLIIGLGAFAAVTLAYNYFTQTVDPTYISSETMPKKARDATEFIRPKYEPVELIDNVITRRSLVQILKAVQADLAGRFAALKCSYKPLRKENYPDDEAYERLMEKYARDQERQQDSSLNYILKASKATLEQFHRAMDRHGSQSDVMAEFFKLKRDSLLTFFDYEAELLSLNETEAALTWTLNQLERVRRTRFTSETFIWQINKILDGMADAFDIDEDALAFSAKHWAKENQQASEKYTAFIAVLEEIQSRVTYEA